MLVGIDSANNLSCTGIVSGSEADIINFYYELRDIFATKKIYPPFHWGKLTNKTRDSVKKPIENLVNNSDLNLKFNILYHKKPLSITKKEILLEIVTTCISEQLREWFLQTTGFVIFEVDNDFNTKNFTTHDFIDKLFKKIFPLLTDKIVAIIVKNGVHKATIKKKFGYYKRSDMYFSGRVSNIKDSRAIQIIDVVLGCVLSEKCKFRYDRLFIRKLC